MTLRPYHDAQQDARDEEDQPMRTRVAMALTIGAALLAVAPALPQTVPEPPATPSPLPPEYGMPLSNEQAKMAATAAFSTAKENNWRMAIAVVGPTGELIYFERMDGVQHASVEIAMQKARMAAFYRRPTKAYADAIVAGNRTFLTFPHVIASEGGIPIIVDGRLVGAIGASGGTGQQSGIVATAGANAVK
jgi:uncharacterized protein GlcG (DUF336 family)